MVFSKIRDISSVWSIYLKQIVRDIWCFGSMVWRVDGSENPR